MSDVKGDGVGPPGLMSGEGGGTLPCALSHDTFDDIYFPLWTDRCLRKHYLPATSFADGKYSDTFDLPQLETQGQANIRKGRFLGENQN